jgi:hypothetical protein
MYIAMLMTGWGSSVQVWRSSVQGCSLQGQAASHQLPSGCPQDKDRIDIGWASVWVKTIALCCTSGAPRWAAACPHSTHMPSRLPRCSVVLLDSGGASHHA